MDVYRAAVVQVPPLMWQVIVGDGTGRRFVVAAFNVRDDAEAFARSRRAQYIEVREDPEWVELREFGKREVDARELRRPPTVHPADEDLEP